MKSEVAFENAARASLLTLKWSGSLRLKMRAMAAEGRDMSAGSGAKDSSRSRFPFTFGFTFSLGASLVAAISQKGKVRVARENYLVPVRHPFYVEDHNHILGMYESRISILPTVELATIGTGRYLETGEYLVNRLLFIASYHSA